MYLYTLNVHAVFFFLIFYRITDRPCDYGYADFCSEKILGCYYLTVHDNWRLENI